jgi:hypothetical protein
MVAQYGPYTIAGLPLGEGLDPQLLKLQINESPLVVSSVSDVLVVGGHFYVDMAASLSQPEKIALDGGVTQVPSDPPGEGSILGQHAGPSTPELLVGIRNTDGSKANFPSTDAGTPIFQSNVVPPGYYFYGTGAFDDVAGNSRGAGPQIELAVSADEHIDPAGKTATLVGRFLEHVYILGGHFAALGADLGDWISSEIVAPASTPEDRTGSLDGNAVKVPTGAGFNVVVPTEPGTGSWNVDGAALEAGEINAGLVPVPSPTQTGFWNWDPGSTPSLSPVSNPAAPDGAYNLFDAALPLARQANRYSCLTEGDVTPQGAVKGKKILPHWLWRFTIHRHAPGTLKVAVRLDMARVQTV